MKRVSQVAREIYERRLSKLSGAERRDLTDEDLERMKDEAFKKAHDLYEDHCDKEMDAARERRFAE